MGILEAYDESNEIVKAEIFTRGMCELPEIAIVVFKTELIDYIKNNDAFEEFSYTLVGGEKIKIYKTNYAGKDVIVYRTLMGGPAAVGMMEELIARGVKKFIVFGSCGQLNGNVPKGAFIIPTEAYRDEGTSYHYLPASEFIKIDTAEKLSQIFEDNAIHYYCTKTWTTDAIYRETVGKVKRMSENGCDVVEMECASIMAMSKLRNIESYQFLYCDDTLESDEWKLRTMQDDRSPILTECLRIALKVVEKI
ncbi:MAG: nucleoside phosphorylase [Clostridia bacterium]|nr:nucleoside phosphorylase [Clostridia bacterium]